MPPVTRKEDTMARKRRDKPRWRYSQGGYGKTVTAFEETNGILYGQRPGETKSGSSLRFPSPAQTSSPSIKE